ncbi:MAG: VanW family protein [Armatimonadota bacterium]
MKSRISGILMIILPIMIVIGLAVYASSTRQTTIGAFTTSMIDRTHEQKHNIRLVAEKLDGAVIRPGEVFSFNGTAGERVSDRGYVSAPVIVKGKLEDGSGGGICQVSSTLYNAALLAGMSIVERNPHTTPVSSVPPGRDATVLFGGADLRFRNDHKEPVIVKVDASGNRLVIRLTGHIADKPEYRITVESDDAVRPISSAVGSSQTRYRTAVVWREKTARGKTQSRELISSDTYKTLP